VIIEEVQEPSWLRTVAFPARLALVVLIVQWLRLVSWISPSHKVGRYARFARSVRDMLVGFGPVGIKLGQTLAMRSDLLPADFVAELVGMRDIAPGVPFARIRQYVEQELGGRLERHFEEFSEEPFTATASFQVHRARLRQEQVWVAVKVLRPYAEDTFARDIALLRRVTKWLDVLRVTPNMRWLELSREVEENATRELDLRFEAASLGQLKKTLPSHGIYVPEVYSRYSTRRMLIMEFIHAALMADYVALKDRDPARLEAWLEENKIKPRKVARRLFHSLWRQVFEDNFFHADLHPDNVILLRNSRLAVIDCRTAGQLEGETLVKHRRLFEALADREFSTAAEYGFLTVSRLPRVDLGEVKAEFTRLWRRWEIRNHVRELPAADKSLTRMLDGITRIMYRYGFEAQWSMARLGWAAVNADTSILHLASDVNYLEWLGGYFRAANRRRSRVRPREIANRLVVMLSATLDLPKTLTADSVAQQEVLRRQSRVVHGSASMGSYVIATMCSFLAVGLLLVGAFLFFVWLDRQFQVSAENLIGSQLMGVIRAAPALGFWPSIAVVLIVTFLFRRVLTVRRVSLSRGVRQRRSRAAV
jgi:ubiquinone biosynthesis protein